MIFKGKKLLLTVTIVAVAGSSLLSTCGKNRPTAPDIPVTQLTENVNLLEDNPSVSISTIDSTSLTYSYSGSAPAIEEGDILAGGSGFEGFLRKVDSYQIGATNIEIQTSQAQLTEAIYNGGYQDSIRMSFNPASDPTGMSRASYAKGVSASEDLIVLDGAVLFSGNVDGANVTVVINEGTLSFEPELDLGFRIRRRVLEEFHAIATGKLVFNFEIGITADASFSYEAFKEIALISKPVWFAIGALPVLVVIDLSLIGGFEIGAGIEGAITAGFDSEISVSCGAKFDGENWSSVWIVPQPTTELRPVSWGASASLDAKAYIRPRLDLKLYAIAGPYLEVGPYLRLDGDVGVSINQLPYYNLDLFLGIDGNVGMSVLLLDELINNVPLPLPSFEWLIGTISDTLGNNFPPSASLQISPPEGDTDQVFLYDATASSDPEDGKEGLKYRYDWENDNHWDLDWANHPTATTTYSNPGEYIGSVEVKDSDGNISKASRRVVVHPDPGTSASLSLLIYNVDGTIWHDGAQVELFDDRGFFNLVEKDTTDSSGMAVFTNLLEKTYFYRVLQVPTQIPNYLEYWGDDEIYVVGNTSDSFTREMPYISGIEKTWDPISGVADIIVTVINADQEDHDVTANILLDKDKLPDPDYDIYVSESPSTVPAYQGTADIPFQIPIPDNGTDYLHVWIQRGDNWVTDQTLAWADSIIASPSESGDLAITVHNIGDVLWTEGATVELYRNASHTDMVGDPRLMIRNRHRGRWNTGARVSASLKPT